MRLLKRNEGCDDVDKDDKGDRGGGVTRLTGFTGKWAALGSSGLYSAHLDCTGVF